MSLYDKLGGEPEVAAPLDGLYTRALADPLLQPFLENVELARLQAHQYAFISQVLGGPHQYSGPSLIAAHLKYASGSILFSFADLSRLDSCSAFAACVQSPEHMVLTHQSDCRSKTWIVFCGDA